MFPTWSSSIGFCFPARKIGWSSKNWSRSILGQHYRDWMFGGVGLVFVYGAGVWFNFLESKEIRHFYERTL
jgi:hypothetical protein